jgi:hypothetical protein
MVRGPDPQAFSPTVGRPGVTPRAPPLTSFSVSSRHIPSVRSNFLANGNRMQADAPRLSNAGVRVLSWVATGVSDRRWRTSVQSPPGGSICNLPLHGGHGRWETAPGCSPLRQVGAADWCALPGAGSFRLTRNIASGPDAVRHPNPLVRVRRTCVVPWPLRR